MWNRISRGPAAKAEVMQSCGTAEAVPYKDSAVATETLKPVLEGGGFLFGVEIILQLGYHHRGNRHCR